MKLVQLSLRMGLFLLVLSRSVWIERAGATSPEELAKNGIHMEGSLKLAKDQFFYGEPILVTVHLTNKGDATIFSSMTMYGVADVYNGYGIHIFNDKGVQVNQTHAWVNMDYALDTDGEIKPGKTREIVTSIDVDCKFPGPGTYTVQMKTAFDLGKPVGNQVSFPFNFPISTEFHLTIKDDPQAISDLLKKIDSDATGWSDPNKCYDDDLGSLGLIKNPDVLKLIAKLLDGPVIAQVPAISAMRYYPQEETVPIITSHFHNLSDRAKIFVLDVSYVAGWPGLPNYSDVIECVTSSNKELSRAALQICCLLDTVAVEAKDKDFSRHTGRFANCLSTICDPKNIATLRKLLKNPDVKVQAMAAVSLSCCSYNEGLTLLIAKLEKPSSENETKDIVSTLSICCFGQNWRTREECLAWLRNR